MSQGGNKMSDIFSKMRAATGWFFEISGKSPKTDATRNVATKET